MLRMRFETFCTTSGNGEIGAELLRIFHVAAAAGLQVAGVRRSIDRSDVEQAEPAELGEFPAQLVAGAPQPFMLVIPRPVYLTLQAGINQFEIEYGDFRRVGMSRRQNHQRKHQRGKYETRSHDRDPANATLPQRQIPGLQARAIQSCCKVKAPLAIKSTRNDREET